MKVKKELITGQEGSALSKAFPEINEKNYSAFSFNHEDAVNQLEEMHACIDKVKTTMLLWYFNKTMRVASRGLFAD